MHDLIYKYWSRKVRLNVDCWLEVKKWRGIIGAEIMGAGFEDFKKWCGLWPTLPIKAALALVTSVGKSKKMYMRTGPN